ncbi:MAG: PEGA domain-containing protein [Prevotellaceae bacterium]|jgi:hypothetical protein|nr:PEGA domain-containing protein [Prevotellaceae bacterium]
MKNFLLKSCIFLCAILIFNSCATLFTGTKDLIHFDSKPQGATVLIDGIEVCKTPCSTKVKRSLSDKQVEFKLDGYTARIITLDQEFNVVSVLNLADILGWAIDAATGSLMKYDRKAYNIELEKKLSQINPETIDVNTKDKLLTLYVKE